MRSLKFYFNFLEGFYILYPFDKENQLHLVNNSLSKLVYFYKNKLVKVSKIKKKVFQKKNFIQECYTISNSFRFLKIACWLQKLYIFILAFSWYLSLEFFIHFNLKSKFVFGFNTILKENITLMIKLIIYRNLKIFQLVNVAKRVVEKNLLAMCRILGRVLGYTKKNCHSIFYLISILLIFVNYKATDYATVAALTPGWTCVFSIILFYGKYIKKLFVIFNIMNFLIYTGNSNEWEW